MGTLLTKSLIGTYIEQMKLSSTHVRNSILPKSFPRYGLGVPPLDKALAGGLALGCVHEFYAAEAEDTVATAGFAMAMALRREAGGAMLWLRSRRATSLGGVLQANGWAELGGAPDRAVVGVVSDRVMLLRAAVDALRSAALGAVIMESWGAMPELDLSASRRLALAAEKSGVPLFLLRCDARAVPSAAQTRWEVAAAPSRALPGNAPGQPAFDITLLRQKSGPCGLAWRLEWDRDQRQFREAEISGDLASVPVRRPAADAGSGSLVSRIAA